MRLRRQEEQAERNRRLGRKAILPPRVPSGSCAAGATGIFIPPTSIQPGWRDLTAVPSLAHAPGVLFHIHGVLSLVVSRRTNGGSREGAPRTGRHPPVNRYWRARSRC